MKSVCVCKRWLGTGVRGVCRRASNAAPHGLFLVITKAACQQLKVQRQLIALNL